MKTEEEKKKGYKLILTGVALLLILIVGIISTSYAYSNTEKINYNIANTEDMKIEIKNDEESANKEIDLTTKESKIATSLIVKNTSKEKTNKYKPVIKMVFKDSKTGEVIREKEQLKLLEKLLYKDENCKEEIEKDLIEETAAGEVYYRSNKSIGVNEEETIFKSICITNKLSEEEQIELKNLITVEMEVTAIAENEGKVITGGIEKEKLYPLDRVVANEGIVENNEETGRPVVTRIKVEAKWKNGEEEKPAIINETNLGYDIEKESNKEKVKEEEKEVLIKYNEEKWEYKEGYYYYKGVLEEKEKTEALIKAIVIGNIDNSYQNKSLIIELTKDVIDSDPDIRPIDWLTDEELGIKNNPGIIKLEIEGCPVKIGVGSQKKLKLKTNIDKLRWESNSDIVTVNEEGEIRGLKEGVATVTVKGINEKEARCDIEVEKRNIINVLTGDNITTYITLGIIFGIILSIVIIILYKKKKEGNTNKRKVKKMLIIGIVTIIGIVSIYIVNTSYALFTTASNTLTYNIKLAPKSIMQARGGVGVRTEMWAHAVTIKLIKFENKITTEKTLKEELGYEGNVEVYDLSANDDNSVVGYFLEDENSLIIQGRDKIYLNEDSSYLFYMFIMLSEIDGLEYVDTSNVTDMSNMFFLSMNLTELDLSHFNTSNVTNMGGMFSNCSRLIFLDLSNWDLSNVTSMFTLPNNNIDIITANWKISNNVRPSTLLKNISDSMMKSYSEDIATWDTSNVTDMSNMFKDMTNITTLDLSKWDTSNVTNMSGMFSGMTNITTLDLSNFDKSKVTDMRHMFMYCTNLQEIKGLEYLDTSNVITMVRMFYGCSSLTSLDLSHFDTSHVTDMSDMFSNCSRLIFLDLSNWDTRKMNINSIFKDINNLSNLGELNLSNWDTSNVTDMTGMFQTMKNITKLDVSNWDTSNVTNMSAMFAGMSNITTLDLSNWDTSNVTDMSDMFDNCSSLTEIKGLENFDTSHVTDMTGMFTYCPSLIEIKGLKNFVTSQVTNMNYMFFNCSSLTSLDVSNFDTSSVTEMIDMFGNCSNLKELNLSNWDTSNVTQMGYLFQNCSSLSKIDLRKATFTQNSFYWHGLDNVPTTVEIIVKDDEQKGWFNRNYPTYTNVKTVEELG